MVFFLVTKAKGRPTTLHFSRSSPGYWKYERGKRKLSLVVKQDRYEVDE
ncbi:hypothetical protein GWK48_10145 [Metallosphaera tengchongensis]|uniref:Uncharacterized protein n=1 Tax=Metallosphaera tengchongensis TaxID=1532350 RepID=A0A6N0P028_9CREN|nr:hypothetical protein [Metallosphaera tengchongensis]QKR00701.1 hypothetical protein GWK48_10145 [Metallosphaera tengchongensis]